MKLEEFEELNDSQKQNMLDSITVYSLVKKGLFVLLVLTCALMGGCPLYNVWEQSLEGKAELARAEQNRQIKINEAKAAKEAAGFLADAEVQRAIGARKANDELAMSFGGPEGYLRYLYIGALQETSCDTIYIPTEANLPILEATRRLAKDNNRQLKEGNKAKQ